ncbi:MAG: hypothetical protein F6K30_19785 [Cyanothece sp. SIO2G6]|nr:hypothetical protein [Cyanothece sp. SIO2G6]
MIGGWSAGGIGGDTSVGVTLCHRFSRGMGKRSRCRMLGAIAAMEKEGAIACPSVLRENTLNTKN